MTPEETDALLREPHLAMIGTLQPGGSPHVTPVWHHYDGDRIFVLAQPSTVKVRNIRRDPRVSVTIATDRKPYQYVLVHGTATLSNEWVPELLRTMAVSYLGPERGERYAERTSREIRFCVITVTPSKIISRAE